LDDGKKLFETGRYEESLSKFRQVLARSPNNQEARQYAQMAESGSASKQAEDQKKRQSAQLADAAKAALAGVRYEEAVQKAEESLAVDSNNADASAVRDDAQRRITESKVAAEAAALKKGKAKEV